MEDRVNDVRFQSQTRDVGFLQSENSCDQFSGPFSLFGGSYCGLEGPESDIDHPSMSRAKVKA